MRIRNTLLPASCVTKNMQCSEHHVYAVQSGDRTGPAGFSDLAIAEMNAKSRKRHNIQRSSQIFQNRCRFSVNLKKVSVTAKEQQKKKHKKTPVRTDQTDNTHSFSNPFLPFFFLNEAKELDHD